MFKQIYFLAFIFLVGCSSDPDRKSGNKTIVPSPFDVTLLNGNSNIKLGEVASLQFTLKETNKVFTDISVYVNDELHEQPEGFPFEIELKTTGLKLGKNTVKLSASESDKIQSKLLSFTLFPDKAPKNYTFNVIQLFDHNENSYTQGLAYHAGFLYEGTGQQGYSTLQKNKLESGENILTHQLDNSLFGEGICILNDQIYQLSWKAQVGFIYDLSTFKENNRFYYQGEGWGLTTDGKMLYRSDGSHKIYLHEPGTFQEKSFIEVYSDQGPIKNLNELEYINGRIYANIWQTDQIAIINPENGLVEGMINLKNLLPKNLRSTKTEVLNGIAYDKDNDRLFLTGKYWPKIIEVKLSLKEEA